VTFRQSSREMGGGVIWITIAAGLNQAATLLAGVLVANAIGTWAFGTYSFFQGTLTSWSQATSLSSGLLATRYLAAYVRTEAKLAGEIIGYCTAMTALASGIGALILLLSGGRLMSNVGDPISLKMGMIAVAAILPFLSLTLFQAGALVGMGKYQAQAQLAAAQAVAFVLGPFIGAHLGGAIGATLGLVAAIAIRFISQRIVLTRAAATFGVRPSYTNFALMTRLFLRFALPASLTGLTTGASLWFSTIMLLDQPDGAHQVGLFGAAQYFRLLVLFVPVQLSTIGVALLTGHLTKGAHAKYAALLRAGIILTATISVLVATVLALLAPQVLRLFGSDFVAALGLARILLLGAVIEATAGALYQALPSREQMWRSFLVVALPRDSAFLIASSLLVPKHLGVGLGQALLISQCVGLAGVVIARSLPQFIPTIGRDGAKQTETRLVEKPE
jgi:O-antigen/teichoic acid export membrane protein